MLKSKIPQKITSVSCEASSAKVRVATLARFLCEGPHICFVCSLLGFNITFKHLRSYRGGAILLQWHFDQCAATQECHATDTGHDTPSSHSIQTRGRPVVVLSIDVKHRTGIHVHNCKF